MKRRTVFIISILLLPVALAHELWSRTAGTFGGIL